MDKVLIIGSNSSLGKVLDKTLKDRGVMTLRVPISGEPTLSWVRNTLKFTTSEERNLAGVVNCWGMNHLSKIGETPAYDEQLFVHNSMLPYWVMDTLVALKFSPCRVVNVASQTYRVPQRCTAIYAGTKAALVHMTKIMARELAPSGWIVNAVAPGKIEDTRMAEMTDTQVERLRGWTKEEADEYAKKLIPMGRFTSCAEVSSLIGNMLFDIPSYVNGTCIDITGGV